MTAAEIGRETKALAAMAEGFCPIEAVYSKGPLVRMTPTTLTDGSPAGWCYVCDMAWHLVDGWPMFTGVDSPGVQAVRP